MNWDKKNKIIALLIVIVIILGFALIYNGIKDYNQRRLNLAYQQGVNDALLQFQQNIITQLNNFGVFTITLPTENNQTATIRLIPQQSQPLSELEE